MPPLLYLVHRIPYPPNKGDKIRSFNWLRGLSSKYEIYLGTFVDDADDEKYRDEMNRYCQEVHIATLKPAVAKVKSISGMLTGQALTVPYYFDAALKRWVDETVRKHDIKKILVFSSSMAQYVSGARYAKSQRVIDFVDVDSDKWHQYAAHKSWPMSYVYRREAAKLFKYEKHIASEFNASVFVSEAEASSFEHMLGVSDSSVSFANNGVDADYFSPEREYENPYPAETFPIVFTGAMDYWANVDAVCWFAKEVFSHVHANHPNVEFYIVGSKPATEVRDLQSQNGIRVTGRVDDVRPYLAHAKLAVAPMRIARGIQNKVLEAMAMAKPVLATPQGYEGIAARPGEDLLVIDGAVDWVRAIQEYFARGDEKMGRNARTCVIEHYSWDTSVSRLEKLLDGVI